MRTLADPWWHCLSSEIDATPGKEERTLQIVRMMEQFLKDVEGKAFRMARYALRDDDEALDAVQDAMLRLVRKYSDRPPEEWRPLFYRILQNGIRDIQRKQVVRNRVMSWFGGGRRDPGEPDAIEGAPDPVGMTPERETALDDSMDALNEAIHGLPRRQQQAFLLRTLDGLSTAETARAMGCSEGSVKTHYSRALHSLRQRLGEYW